MDKLTFSDLRRLQTNQIQFTADIYERYGGVAQFKIMGMTLCFISEPDVIRELLIKKNKCTHRDRVTTDIFTRVTGRGVFVSEGETWRRQRKLVQPAFHAMRIQNYAKIMQEYTTDMIRGWEEGQTLAFDAAFTELTLRIIARTMYGVDIDEQTEKIGRLMGEISEIAEQQLQMTMVPPTWIPTKLNVRQKRIRKEIEAVLNDIIDERRQDPENNDDLLSMMILARDEEGRPMPEQQLLHECLTLFLAGHETTAALLTWATYLLTEYPEIVERLKREVDEVLGERPIEFKDLENLPYLDAVLKETLRMYPPAYGFGRMALEPFSIGDVHFPKGAIIMVNTYVLHHRPDLFPEPDQFIPDRFLDPTKQPDRYEYLPFGAGPRVCVGNMFAMMEAAVILATLVQKTTFARATKEPISLETRVTLRPKDPLQMRVSLNSVAIDQGLTS